MLSGVTKRSAMLLGTRRTASKVAGNAARAFSSSQVAEDKLTAPPMTYIR